MAVLNTRTTLSSTTHEARCCPDAAQGSTAEVSLHAPALPLSMLARQLSHTTTGRSWGYETHPIPNNPKRCGSSPSFTKLRGPCRQLELVLQDSEIARMCLSMMRIDRKWPRSLRSVVDSNLCENRGFSKYLTGVRNVLLVDKRAACVGSLEFSV